MAVQPIARGRRRVVGGARGLLPALPESAILLTRKLVILGRAVVHRANVWNRQRVLTDWSVTNSLMTISSSSQEPRWRRLPEERPRQIIDAALAIFGERGLASARLEDIAKRAGLSKGTIYLYFPNKEELFREMVRALIVAQLEASERELGTGFATATDALVGFMKRYWAFIRSAQFAPL